MPADPPRWFATPLDAASALARARQLDTLASPDRLRVLSAITARPQGKADGSSLARELDLTVSEVEDHLVRLVDADLIKKVDDDADQFTPTPDAWVRFGRLLTRPDASPTPAAATDSPLPEEAGQPLGADMPPVLQRITDRLAYRFSSSFSRETVERYVADSYRLLADRARVPNHLPSLTSRFASDRLGALAVATGRQHAATPELLFICTQNAGRSQLAAALTRQMAGRQVHVRTAGSRPADRIDPTIVTALDEIGVPIVTEFPKPLTHEVVQAADYVVTMGCGDACPLYPGRRYMDWPVADPISQPLEAVRAIRDDVARRVRLLCEEMGVRVSPV